MSTITSNMAMLFSRASENLTDDDLDRLDGLSQVAEDAAVYLQQVVEGIGCYVLNDSAEENGRKKSHCVGLFQETGSVSNLLFNIAHQVDMIGGLVRVSGEANFARIERAKVKSEGDVK